MCSKLMWCIGTQNCKLFDENPFFLICALPADGHGIFFLPSNNLFNSCAIFAFPYFFAGYAYDVIWHGRAAKQKDKRLGWKRTDTVGTLSTVLTMRGGEPNPKSFQFRAFVSETRGFCSDQGHFWTVKQLFLFVVWTAESDFVDLIFETTQKSTNKAKKHENFTTFPTQSLSSSNHFNIFSECDKSMRHWQPDCLRTCYRDPRSPVDNLHTKLAQRLMLNTVGVFVTRI